MIKNIQNQDAEMEIRKEDATRRRKLSDQNDIMFQRKQQLWAEEDKKKQLKETLGLFEGAAIESDAASKENRTPNFSSDQQKAIIELLKKNPVHNENDVSGTVDAIQGIQSFMKQYGQEIMANGGKLDRAKFPELFTQFEKVFESQLNKGTDKNGLTTKDGVKKQIQSVIVDPNDQSLIFNLSVKSPVKEGQTFKQPPGKPPKFVVSTDRPGMVEVGNIDLSKRPVVRNADGSVSTVRPILFKDDDGEEIVIPTISDDGKQMTDQEAISQYKKTGNNLGKFDNAINANAYMEKLSAEQSKYPDVMKYDATGQTETEYTAPITAGRDSDQNAQIIKLPIPILDAYLSSNLKLGSIAQQLRAQLGDSKYFDMIQGQKVKAQEGKAVKEALKGLSLTKADDKRKFIEKLPDVMSIVDKTKMADSLWSKSGTGLSSAAGKEMSDRAKISTEYGEDSTQMKQFDKIAGEIRNKGKKTLDPNSLSSKRFIADQQQDAEKSLLEYSKSLISEDLDTMKKEAIGKSKSLDAVMKEIPEAERAMLKDIRKKMLKFIDEGMTAAEAFSKAKKESSVKKQELKPIDKETAKEIYKESGNDAKKATKIAKERGFDVEDIKEK